VLCVYVCVYVFVCVWCVYVWYLCLCGDVSGLFVCFVFVCGDFCFMLFVYDLCVCVDVGVVFV